ncbi:MAG: AAA family ATPase [Spirochaetales bacterium]|jgi:cytidylate kinase|nr:AAA family ATPase [Spirochaetales bacterium]
MSNDLKIAISGKSGCGNTTVSKIVAEKLNLRLINYTFHTMAEEQGISFRELCERAEKDSSYDKHLDRKQIEMASEGNCVLGSRLAIWLFKDADIKIFLTAPAEVRARRIAEREGEDLERVMRETAERDERDRQRYLRLYNLDNNKYDFADLIIETEKYDQWEEADLIIKAVRGRL